MDDFRFRDGYWLKRHARDDTFRWQVWSSELRFRRDHYEFADIAAEDVDITHQGVVYTPHGIVYTCFEQDGPVLILHAHFCWRGRLWRGEGLQSSEDVNRGRDEPNQTYRAAEFARLVVRLAEMGRYRAQVHMVKRRQRRRSQAKLRDNLQKTC